MVDDSAKSYNNARYEQFLSLLMGNQNYIYAYILSFVPNIADADDLFQGVTMLMWRKFDDYQVGTNFRSWGVAIARNFVLKFYRDHKKQKPLTPETVEILSEEAPERLNELTDRLSVLKKCVTRLRSEDGDLIKMRYEEELTYQRIATRIGVSIQRVYQRISRIHEVLLRCVRRSLLEESAG